MCHDFKNNDVKVEFMKKGLLSKQSLERALWLKKSVSKRQMLTKYFILIKAQN